MSCGADKGESPEPPKFANASSFSRRFLLFLFCLYVFGWFWFQFTQTVRFVPRITRNASGLRSCANIGCLCVFGECVEKQQYAYLVVLKGSPAGGLPILLTDPNSGPFPSCSWLERTIPAFKPNVGRDLPIRSPVHPISGPRALR
jgi:hypothetical protein